MDHVIIIPARFKSSRLPGKPLVDILGTPLVIRVWKQCLKVKGISSDQVIIATDDKRIADCCDKYGARFIYTSENCLTGTDRVAEVATRFKAKRYINVQGDEPLIDPSDIEKIIELSKDNSKDVFNCYAKISEAQDYFSKTVPKVVFRPDGRLLYMSRGPIVSNKQHEFVKAWKQICIYSFTKESLDMFARKGCDGKTPLEEQEDIEILRFLEMGLEVQMVEVENESLAVDVPSDIKRVEDVLRKLEK